MKISVSLPAEDVELLDDHAKRMGLSSRSAVLHQAVGLLRHLELEADYESAWEEWGRSADGKSWSVVDNDGLPDASR